jgi:hypothetical protein
MNSFHVSATLIFFPNAVCVHNEHSSALLFVFVIKTTTHIAHEYFICMRASGRPDPRNVYFESHQYAEYIRTSALLVYYLDRRMKAFERRPVARFTNV